MILILRPADEPLTIVVAEVHPDARHALVGRRRRSCARGRRKRCTRTSSGRGTDRARNGRLKRERLTEVGPVDLFCRDAEGRVVSLRSSACAPWPRPWALPRSREQAQHNADARRDQRRW